MTLEATTSRAQYSTNGTTGPFAVPFYFLDSTHLSVVYTTAAGVITPLTLTTNYTVTGAGVPAGGSITLVTPYAAGGTISIVRNVPKTQLTDYEPGDAFPAAAHEQALDKLTMIAQQIDEQSSRSLRVPEIGVLPELPAAATRADKLLSFDASGNPIVVAPVAGTANALSVDLASTASGKGDALIGVKSVRTGGTARTQHDKNADVTSVKDLGAVGDGAAADGPALRLAAGAFGILGGQVLVPNGTYITDANAGSCVAITDPVSFVGDGGTYTAINPASASASDNTFSIIPGSTDHTLQKLEGIALLNPNTGARIGNHGVYLDTQTAARNLPLLQITGCQVGQGTNATGYGIYHLNNATNNINGGLYGSLFDCNAIKGGIKLENSGDSVNINHNVITGTGIGVNASLVAGASLLQVQGNNITTSGGAFRLDNGSRFRLLGNNCENIGAGATAQNDGAVVNVTGNNGVIYGGIIAQNHIAAFAGTDATTIVRLRNCVGTVVENNVIIAEDAGTVGIDIGATCTNVRIGPNLFNSPISPKITDNGVGTMGVLKTATLLNSWVAFAAGTATLQYIKSGDGMVHVFGVIKSGTTANGTLIATLPAGFRPTEIVRAPLVFVSGGVMAPAEVSVESDGSVRIVYVTASTQLNINFTFPADNLANAVSLE